jgi:heme/copper-type cytochrome/quinol oxidase subunit 3
MSTSMAPATLAPAPAPRPTRPRTLLIGSALAVVGCTALFGALIAIFLDARDAAGGMTSVWVPEDITFREVVSTTAVLTLIASAFTVQWAVWAIARNDRRTCYVALGLTTVFGIAFMNSMGYVYRTMGLDIRRDVYSLLVFSLTGTHLLVLLCALVFLALITFRTLGGRYSGRETEGLTALALFWHFTVAAGIAVWAIVFALK